MGTSGSPAQVSVRLESVANTTNELTKPLQLVHGYPSQYQPQPQQRLRNRQRSAGDTIKNGITAPFRDTKDLADRAGHQVTAAGEYEADYSPAQCSLNLLVLALPVLAAATLLQSVV